MPFRRNRDVRTKATRALHSPEVLSAPEQES